MWFDGANQRHKLLLPKLLILVNPTNGYICSLLSFRASIIPLKINMPGISGMHSAPWLCLFAIPPGVRGCVLVVLNLIVKLVIWTVTVRAQLRFTYLRIDNWYSSISYATWILISLEKCWLLFIACFSISSFPIWLLLSSCVVFTMGLPIIGPERQFNWLPADIRNLFKMTFPRARCSVERIKWKVPFS